MVVTGQYQWEQRAPLDDVSDDTVQRLAAATSVPEIVVRLAAARGYRDETALRAFLTHERVFHDPFQLHDMERLVTRLTEAIETQEKILIYGDYDADGITSTAILYETLENLGANVEFYLPDRFEDGYGPNRAVYQYFIRRGVQLILTCDNGVRGFEAIDYAESQGVDVLVTDHHELADSLPNAYAIVHPRHPDGSYPFGDLCGAGVALKVATALTGAVPTEQLDLAAIGTIADVVSLTDENRWIVWSGLTQMKQSERVGLQLLLQAKHIEPEQIDAETVSFQIAPALNSLGRLEQATPGVTLLTTFDEEEAQTIVTHVLDTNEQRKALVSDTMQQAEAQVAALDELPNFLLLSDPEWHEGILGIVAGRLAERYHRPTIVMKRDEGKGYYKGSGRSVPGVNLYDILTQAEDKAAAWGGHAMACGVTVNIDQFADWKELVEAAARPFADALEHPEPKPYDLTVSPEAVTPELITAIAAMAPFGQDNPKPVFRLPNIATDRVSRIGQNSHTLKVLAGDADQPLPLIGFRRGTDASLLQGVTHADFFVTLQLNHWRGNTTAQGIISDFASAEPGLFDLRTARRREDVFMVKQALYLFQSKKYFDAYQSAVPKDSRAVLFSDHQSELPDGYRTLVLFDCIHDIAALRQLITEQNIENIYLFVYSKGQAYTIGLPTRPELKTVYQYVKTHEGAPLRKQTTALAHYLRLSPAKLQLILRIFNEAELIEWQGERVHVPNVRERVDLAATPTWQWQQHQMQSERLFRYQPLSVIRQTLFGSEAAS